jgi:hypothetical protein
MQPLDIDRLHSVIDTESAGREASRMAGKTTAQIAQVLGFAALGNKSIHMIVNRHRMIHLVMMELIARALEFGFKVEQHTQFMVMLDDCAITIYSRDNALRHQGAHHDTIEVYPFRGD